jgi:hypothetical protein
VLVSTVANLPDGTIRWKGDGFVAGSQPFAGLATDASNTVDLTLRVAADAPRPDVRRSVEVSTTGGDGAGLPGQARVFVGNDEGVANVADLVPGVAETIKGPTATWAVAVRGSWASDPVRVDAGGGVSLLLRPGGSLVLDVKSRPPASLGELLLRRRDGGPILTDGGVLPQMQVRAELGTVLGPLPEGPVDFVLELMGENVGEVHATVKAGAKETLRVPSVAPR